MYYRTCISSLCSTGCCDYYAYCVYPNQTPFCYTNITYYYEDLWWVWTICSIVLLCIILGAIAGCRRRRRLRRMEAEQILIQTNTVNPSIVQGQPVYPNDNTLVMGAVPGNQAYYQQNQPFNNQPYNNQGYVY